MKTDVLLEQKVPPLKSVCVVVDWQLRLNVSLLKGIMGNVGTLCLEQQVGSFTDITSSLTAAGMWRQVRPANQRPEITRTERDRQETGEGGAHRKRKRSLLPLQQGGQRSHKGIGSSPFSPSPWRRHRESLPAVRPVSDSDTTHNPSGPPS